jgi:hypothetical protein
MSLVVLLLASCGDSRELLSPAQGGTQPLASVQDGENGPSSNNASGNGQSEDRLPSDLGPVASFTAPSANNGADRVSAVIGSGGGSLRLGDYEVVVPAGAVSEPTRFSIITFPETSARKHAIASFLPHRSFDQAVTVRLPLSTTESAGSPDPSVIWWDGESWVPLVSAITADGRVETHTTHFSLYATCRSGFTLAGG